MTKRQNGRWPAWKKPAPGPTKLCSACNGSGCPPGELQAIMNGGPMQGPRRCSYCYGSGRVPDHPVPMTKVCAHDLPVADCALCREPTSDPC